MPKGGMGVSSYGVEAEVPQVLPLPGWREFCSPSWRFWLREDQGPPAAHLLTVTAEPAYLHRVAGVVAEVVRLHPQSAPKVIRLARDAAALQWLNQTPRWAGRAVTLYMESEASLIDIAYHVDHALAGQGLSGPPSFRGRPYGGQSGMLFLGGPPAGEGRYSSDHSDRLTVLLGGLLP